ncbi:DUF4401 domain-containing protein [Shewanella sp. ENK2]|uniref:DUF4401 domain-containing protein n=1 Tax=Shewanella sp. ENK2 TaxID=2775245 RepID=UPI003748C47E
MKQSLSNTNKPIHGLWQLLIQHQLVMGEAPEKTEITSPWFVKLLLAIAGWFAASFFLGFVALGLEFIFDEDSGPYIMGAVLVLVAYVLLLKIRNEFLEHLALALSFCGQILLVYGFIQHTNDDVSWLMATVLQLSLLFMMPNDIHRFCSAFIAGCCLMVTLALLHLPFIGGGVVLMVACWLLLNEFNLSKKPMFAGLSRHKRPIAYGLLLSQVLQSSLMAFQYHWYKDIGASVSQGVYTAPWMGNVLLAFVSLYVAQTILSRHPELSQKLRYWIFAVIVIISVLSFEAPGINVGILLLILGFSASNYLLTGVGITALLSFISAYYYFLHYPLFEKSITLIVMGLVLLGMRWFLLKSSWLNGAEASINNVAKESASE